MVDHDLAGRHVFWRRSWAGYIDFVLRVWRHRNPYTHVSAHLYGIYSCQGDLFLLLGCSGFGDSHKFLLHGQSLVTDLLVREKIGIMNT